MIIDCIADLHGHYPKLEGGDLLIVAGDLTAHDVHEEYIEFFQWLLPQKYTRKILVAGNHDNRLKNLYIIPGEKTDLTYLCDSGTEFEGLKIWGSPWTSRFPGINPKCCAFTGANDEEIADKFALIPDDIDILITHSPPNGVLLDGIHPGKFAGSRSLRNEVMNRIKPKLHVFGHIHEWGGTIVDFLTTKFVNASHVNERYQPVNKPIRIDL